MTTGQVIKSTSLPHPPSPSPFTPAQWQVLLAIADTVIAPLQPAAAATPHDREVFEITRSQLQGYADDATLDSYLSERASSVPGFEDALLRFLGSHTAPDVRKGLASVLNLLEYVKLISNRHKVILLQSKKSSLVETQADCSLSYSTRPGGLVLTGSPTPFALQSIAAREAALQGWCTARLPLLRLLHRQLTTVVKSAWAKTSPTIGPVLGFPRAPVNHRQGQGFAFDFLQFPPSDEPEFIETDVVIVGSGCGAGVCAKKIAEAGFRTIVVDRSCYWPPEYLPMTDLEGQEHMFMNGGAVVCKWLV